MIEVRKAALAWVRRALCEELRDPPEELAQRAENLVAIAEHYQVPIEALIKWIHIRSYGKQWSAAEWRRWCQLFQQVHHREITNP